MRKQEDGNEVRLLFRKYTLFLFLRNACACLLCDVISEYIHGGA